MSAWLPEAILRTASLLAPVHQRSDWLYGWRSELWYIPQSEATAFCLGAFRDALWVRRNDPGDVDRPRVYLESPASCLAFLTLVAAVSILLTILLPAPPETHLAHLPILEVLKGCLGVSWVFAMFLAATRLVVGRKAAGSRPASWQSVLRRWIFFGVKVMLLQPVILCSVVFLIAAGKVPFLPQLICALTWALACRWVFADQQRRCPVCLRLLARPVRIGTPSQTLLDWYGAESVCSRGHGLLQNSEITASYSSRALWLKLDSSWSSLFPAASRGRSR